MVAGALGRRNYIQMKILVIDDHVLIRESLQGVLREWQRDAAILEASDCRQAMQLIEEHTDLELVLLDLNLPDGDGFHVLADLQERYPAISVVVLSASKDRDSMLRALDLGALGFIPKSARRAVMLSAEGLALGFRPDPTSAGSARPHDAGEEQQDDLSLARGDRGDG
jgi:DNA-binding NarL/FixJ family response regulator